MPDGDSGDQHVKVLTIGSAMIDSIALIASDRIERMAMRNADTSYLLLEEGKKIEADAISTHCGGGAVNAAIAYARLGFDAAALIKLGQDARADQILTRLGEEGVSTRFATRDARAPTGASVLVSAHDRNAAVFAFRGANTLLEAEDLKTDAFGVDVIHVSGLSNKSAECFPLIVQKAKAAKARLAINPGIRQLSLQPAAFLKLLADVDILSINRTEANALVAQIVATAGEGGAKLVAAAGETLPPLAMRGFAGGGFEITMPQFFATLASYGVNHVIVTDGGDGAYAGTAAGAVYCPALTGPVAGTAGAGDAFVSTFAACLTRGADAGDALQMAAINASSVIQFADTQTGLLTRLAIEQRHGTSAQQLPLRRWSW
jgi:ribokinase